MRFRFCFCLLGCLVISASGAFPQINSPSKLRSAARALTAAEISGVAGRASSGDTEAQLMMGLTLQLVAERIRYDPQAAGDMYRSSVYWFRKASEKGYAPAQYFLAKSDLKLLECADAFESLDKAIAQNYAPAMTAMGQLYMDGACGKNGYAPGLQWLRKAAEAGDAEAYYFIGIAHEQGQGVAVDQAEATRWFLKGARMGHPSSQNKLAINLAEGIGTPTNLTEAVGWFRKSAEQGNYEAACNLALHYMRGQGVPKNYVTSLMWGLIADVNAIEIGCLDEIDTRDLLQMTPAQITEATERANVWLKEHHYPPTEAPVRVEE
jgi:TPR repeat protein